MYDGIRALYRHTRGVVAVVAADGVEEERKQRRQHPGSDEVEVVESPPLQINPSVGERSCALVHVADEDGGAFGRAG